MFKRAFTLGAHVEVVSATMRDGLLTVQLERRLPEAEKARSIPIDAQ